MHGIRGGRSFASPASEKGGGGRRSGRWSFLVGGWFARAGMEVEVKWRVSVSCQPRKCKWP